MSDRKFHVLVVDDEPAVAQTIAWVLQEAGYTALFALNRKSAIDCASGIALDLALVDVILPDLDGIKTAVEICKRLPNCKILLMSGDTDAAPLLHRAKVDGVNFEVLAKPIDPPELLSTVRSFLANDEARRPGRREARLA